MFPTLDAQTMQALSALQGKAAPALDMSQSPVQPINWAALFGGRVGQFMDPDTLAKMIAAAAHPAFQMTATPQPAFSPFVSNGARPVNGSPNLNGEQPLPAEGAQPLEGASPQRVKPRPQRSAAGGTRSPRQAPTAAPSSQESTYQQLGQMKLPEPGALGSAPAGMANLAAMTKGRPVFDPNTAIDAPGSDGSGRAQVKSIAGGPQLGTGTAFAAALQDALGRQYAGQPFAFGAAAHPASSNLSLGNFQLQGPGLSSSIKDPPMLPRGERLTTPEEAESLNALMGMLRRRRADSIPRSPY